MKFYLSAFVFLLFSFKGFSQFLYGFSGNKFVKLDLTSGQITPVISGLGFYEYQGNTTSDLSHRYFYLVKGIQNSEDRDTLVTINISNHIITKDTLPKGFLYWPEYHDEKIYGISARGIYAYDLATHQLSLVDSSVKAGKVEKAGFNHASKEYVFLKKGPTSTGPANFDTLCKYQIGSGTLDSALILSSNICMEYSENANLAYMLSGVGGKRGVFEYDFNSQTFTMGAEYINGGVYANTATSDPQNNKYYFIKVGGSLNVRDTIMIYDAGSKTIAKRDVPQSAIANIEFFPAEPVGVPGTAKDLPLAVFPNPAKEFIYLKADGSFNGAVSITDAAGRVVFEKALSGAKNEIDIRSLIPGNYFISISQNGRNFIRQFIKE